MNSYRKDNIIAIVPENPRNAIEIFVYSRNNHHVSESRFLRHELRLVTKVKNMLFGLLFIDAVLHLISFILIYNTDAKPAKLKTRFTRNNEKSG